MYAASFLRRREIVLDAELIERPRLLQLILIHELFHFVWVRLGNPRRARFGRLLANEYAQRARGELGESAAVQKSLLNARDCVARSSRWRDYVCESFCDTAAWHFSRIRQSGTFTLSSRWRKRRAQWFEESFAGGSNGQPASI